MVNLVPIDISNNESALNVLETFAMIRLSDWEKPTVDVVPLFESVEDLLNAHNIMEQLYTNPMYANHLE
jgi:phosphoenolpyruvate carboxylase